MTRGFLLAPDSFKNSLRAAEVAAALRAGISRDLPDASVHVLPLGDGGEGSAEALAAAGVGVLHVVPVDGPDGRRVQGRVLLIDHPEGPRAWVEAASACGLEVTTSAHPRHRTSAGVGQLLRAAAGLGARDITLGCGGTATIDAGLGMLAALGASTRPAPSSPHGPALADLATLEAVDPTPARQALQGVTLRAAVDVTHPLGGPTGAIAFASQKGAAPGDLPGVLQGLDRASAAFDAHAPVSTLPGAGAAGGLPAALALLGAELTSGFDAVASLLALDAAIARADVVVTGEGRLDHTSFEGKVVAGVLARAAGRAQVWIVAGQATAEGVERALALGATAVLTLTSAADPDALDARAEPQPRLVRLGQMIARASRPA